jgi:hypothetical protein
MWPAEDVKPAVNGCASGPLSQQSEQPSSLVALLHALIQSQQALTQALVFVAESNHSLAQALTNDDEGMEPEIPQPMSRKS